MSVFRHTRAVSGRRGVSMIELLVAMSVMGILTTMILTSWFVLQSSASSSSQQSIQRDTARQALARMATELRDAQGRLGSPAITAAAANSVTFSSTFNNAGNNDQTQVPHIVRYRYLTGTGTVTRTEDTDNDGSLTDEQATVLLTNVVNTDVKDENGLPAPVPVFTYSYYTNAGDLVTVDSMTSSGTVRIITVGIRLLVDVRPNKSPTFMDLSTSVQPRNLRN